MTTPEEAIEVLNRINAADPSVLPRLIEHRVSCNQALADDPTVQVKEWEPGKFTVGLLGVLNGIFGLNPETKSAGYIAAYYDDGDPRRLIDFRRTGG